MPTQPEDRIRKLTRQEASDAITAAGWRYLSTRLLVTQVPARSLGHAAEIAAMLTAAAGPAADDHLWLDLRADRLLIGVKTIAAGAVTSADVKIAAQISAAATAAGLETVTRPAGQSDLPGATGAGESGAAIHRRSVQQVEIAIDAMDILAIRPFWLAVLGYQPEPGFADDPEGSITDPAGQGPAIWFQQMDAPRPQRNRIHFDVDVPHDEARGRIEAAIAAGGRLTYDAEAPAFWVLADPEGNEACVCTWQGRDS
jgi:4a-hydroxytetrahydrobiopterin dehydratase